MWIPNPVNGDLRQVWRMDANSLHRPGNNGRDNQHITNWEARRAKVRRRNQRKPNAYRERAFERWFDSMWGG